MMDDAGTKGTTSLESNNESEARVSTWCLAEANYRHICDAAFEMAVMPLGSSEPHNLHLSYATDTRDGEAIDRAVCSEAAAQGANIVLHPTLPYGTQTNMRAPPLAMNLNPSTPMRFLEDLVESLVGSEIRKVVFLTMHSGNELNSVVRELTPRSGGHLATARRCGSIRSSPSMCGSA